MRTKVKHKRPIQQISPCALVEYIGMEILCPIPRTKSGGQFVVVFSEWYSLMARDIPVPDISITDIAFIRLNQS